MKNEISDCSGSNKTRKVSWAEQPNIQLFKDNKIINGDMGNLFDDTKYFDNTFFLFDNKTHLNIIDLSVKYENNEDIISPPKGKIIFEHTKLLYLILCDGKIGFRLSMEL